MFYHVAVVANINDVVVNKPANPHKIRGCSFFNFSKNYLKKVFRSVLDYHILKVKISEDLIKITNRDNFMI